MVDRMKQTMARGSGRGRDGRRIEHHDAVATGPVCPRWPVAPVVAACLLALGCGPASAANGGGGKALFGSPVTGVGGIDGTASTATGKDGAPVGATGNGAGGGAVNLTTGAGAAGGQPSVGSTNIDTPGTNGATGLIGVSTVSGTITGGVGQAGQSVSTGLGSTGGGGGGAGVATTVDLTVGNADRVTGGAGGAGGTDAGSGGGGVGVFSSANVAVAAGGVVIGGAGGNSAVGSGGGGGGAAAIVLTAEGTVDNGGALTGGHGGGAGSTLPSFSGAGGSGGEGVLLTAGGAVINRAGASITGGAAGTNGTAIAAQGIPASVGGAGIEGANVSIINAGTITGGQTAPGTLADAIQFTGGVNSLELQAGSTITGNVVAFSAADTFALGGDTDSSFNVSTLGATAQYQGFGIYNKTGASTWTLTGATTAVTPWTLTAGTLSISSDGNLGDSAGALTFDGGTLQTTADFTMNRAITLDAAGGAIETQAGTTLTQQGQISGAGSLTKTGDGNLTLTANNTYTGATAITAGTLALTGTGSIAASSGVSDDGTFDIAATTAGASIKSLSGGGVVNLGGQTLTLTAATDTFGGVIQGTGGLTLAAGTETLTGANTYSGNTTISAGTLVVGDAAHANASIGSGLTTIAAGATLAGYGTVAGSVNNAGTIAVADAPPAFSGAGLGTLRIGGNYTGTNGQLLLNAVLNQGTTTQLDQLMVAGNTSGTTGIVLHASGLGTRTTGDGVELVQVGGTSAANSFHLSAPVQGGAYQYLLYQGGAASMNNWFLRSALEAPAAASGAAQPEVVAYRPGVVGYSMTSSLNVDYGFTILGRLQERVGDIANLDDAQPGNKDGIWGRISGESLDADSMNRFSSEERTFLAQFGKDWTLSRGESGGSTHAGVTVNFGSSSANFDDDLRSINPLLSNAAGSVETQAQSVGGYWTRYLPDGTYFDGVGQLTHYQNQYGDVFGDSASQNGFGAGVSGEVGKPFALGSSSVAIEPQAQLSYQYVHLNQFDDGVSSIGGTSTNALRGRIGFRLFRANLSNDTKTGAATPYFTADVLHDFFSPGQTSVGGTSFDNGLSKTWYEVGGGVTTSMGKSSELYANIKYARNLGGEYRQDVFGQAGYRYSW
jgi:outer membrane autotransporter protein